jgi:lycopene cyclase domain-containing protein
VSTYGWVLIFTIVGPLALSFDKKVHFYTYFKPLFKAIIPVAVFFLLWDSFFTYNQIWGFNQEYLAKFYIYNLPIEEVLFFFLVPYACIFIYEVLIAYFPTLKLNRLANILSYILLLCGLLMLLFGTGNWYTSSACIIGCGLILYTGIINKKTWYPFFILSFIIALIPFVIVNGVLTGAITENPIVWYANSHIIGLRIITIPVEDIYYNLSMLLPIVWIYERLK